MFSVETDYGPSLRSAYLIIIIILSVFIIKFRLMCADY